MGTVSPDLTTNDPEKLKDAGGPVAIENSTAEYHSTIITVAESPADKGQIWVGTDDGNLQMTTDGGKNWTNLVKNVSGIPQTRRSRTSNRRGRTATRPTFVRTPHV